MVFLTIFLLTPSRYFLLAQTFPKKSGQVLPFKRSLQNIVCVEIGFVDDGFA